MTKQRRTTKSIAVLLSILMLFSAIVPAVYASGVDGSLLPNGYRVTSEKTYKVVSGVTERHFTLNNKSNSNQIKSYALEVDLSNPDVSVIAGYNDGDTDGYGRATVLNQASAIESKRGVHVIGGVNADFFNKENGCPTGLLVMQSVVGHGSSYEPFFGITKDGTPVIRSAYSSYDDIAEGVGGNTILVKDGKVLSTDAGYLAPRTSVGIKADGSVVLFVADGRQAPESCGMTNYEVACTMASLGCVDALSLDGGGSSTFVTRREAASSLTTKNNPCYNVDRPVSTSLLVCSTAEPTGVFDHVAFSAENYECNSSSSVKISVSGVDENGFAADLPSGGKIVLRDSSYGRISGTRFYAKGKNGTVTADYVIDDVVYGSCEITVSDDADTALDSAVNSFIQSILNIFQFIKFAMEKLKSYSGGPLF